MSKIYMISKRVGKLLVESFSHYDPKYRYNYWNCLCDCGNYTKVSTASLNRKKNPTRSCGCYRNEQIRKNKPWNLKPNGDANTWSLYLTYKRSSKKRNIKFNIEYDDFRILIKKDCSYCGVEPSQIHKKPETNGSCIYNGLDRVDSNKGYFIENVVTCCKTCNYSKRLMTKQEFKDWICRVYEHFARIT